VTNFTERIKKDRQKAVYKIPDKPMKEETIIKRMEEAM